MDIVTSQKGRQACVDLGAITPAQAQMLANTAASILLDAGVLANNACIDGPLLLMALEDYNSHLAAHDQTDC